MKGAKRLTEAAIIAALYVVMTMISAAFGLSGGAIQLRLSEALCVLPVMFSSAVPGLIVGCFLANVISGCVLWDVVFGTLATALSAICTRCLRHTKIPAAVPTVLFNSAIIPFVLRMAYGVPESLSYLIVTIAVGEILSCGVLGTVLLTALRKTKYVMNGN